MLFTKEMGILPIVLQASQKYNVAPALILAHIKQESSFNPLAYRAEPQIGDASTGLMQILVGTAKSFDSSVSIEKLKDPVYNIDLGTAYIAQNLKKWPNILDAIAAYNAGTPRKDEEGYYVNSKGVRNVQEYVNKVYKNFEDYTKWLQHGAKNIDVTIVEPIWIVVFGIATVGIGYLVLRRYYGTAK